MNQLDYASQNGRLATIKIGSILHIILHARLREAVILRLDHNVSKRKRSESPYSGHCPTRYCHCPEKIAGIEVRIACGVRHN